MPKIPEIFRGMEKFKHATTLDWNMGYYSMPLDNDTKALCVSVLPWGLYEYNALPMGIIPATNLKALGFFYFEDHLHLLQKVLQQLLDAGLQVNPEKYQWFAHHVQYLGFNTSRDGISPQKEKIQGILNMSTPKNQKEVRCFVGLVNFYSDLYPWRAEILAPLTTLCGKNSKFIWNAEHKAAFEKVKETIAKEMMLTYPDFTQPFLVHTNASSKQIGGVICQHGKPLGFFSKKLTAVQQRYPVTEQELLAIVETLKYFRHMLIGH
jgi:hypothetical protein